MQEGAVLLGGFGLAHAADHLQTCSPQLGDATTSYPGIGITEGHHHSAQSSGKNRFGARRVNLTLR